MHWVCRWTVNWTCSACIEECGAMAVVTVRKECWWTQQPPVSHKSAFSHSASSDTAMWLKCTWHPPKCNIYATICNERDPWKQLNDMHPVTLTSPVMKTLERQRSYSFTLLFNPFLIYCSLSTGQGRVLKMPSSFFCISCTDTWSCSSLNSHAWIILADFSSLFNTL